MTSFVRFFCVILGLGPMAASAEVHWQHPAGMVTAETIAEVKAKLAKQAWASGTWENRKRALAPWLDASSAELARVFPKRRGNVYHDFSCPQDRKRLTFSPFNPDEFTCPSCGRKYPPETNAGVYPTGDRYYGTMWDGWACLFWLEVGQVAADLGLIGRIESRTECTVRGIELLMLAADTIEKLPTKQDPDPQMRVMLTYHREGDNKVLNDCAVAYELLRDAMTGPQRERFERAVLKRMLDDIMLEPIYRYDHNNVYQWHRTIIQAALCLEREDLIDWSMGYGEFTPEKQPEHRSVRRLAAAHFKPDGAYWEMCSGYHLYPVFFFCELAVVSHNVSQMDPARFPPGQYDLTSHENASGATIKRALEWFLSMAPPDHVMPTVGDSMAPKAGMTDYYAAAEAGYRFFDVKGIGDYESLRGGAGVSPASSATVSRRVGEPLPPVRTWAGLLYGAPEIIQHELPYTSSCLSSGWVSLRNEWKDNRVWVGLNALIPGGGHQHADRLGILIHSHGQLLALEKATPYNDAVTRELGTLSPMHNTVTVDKVSQKQGEALTAAETPKVAYFFSTPAVKFAEIRADKLYPQASVYRRKVALVEDIVVDVFTVQGGKVHDWMLHHAGPAPRLSLDTAITEFTPAPWLANGTKRVRHAQTDSAWEARWSVGEVTSRLTMLPAGGTDVYALETFPIDNAIVTTENPPCQTLCVRRQNDAPFVAVWDTWRDSPHLAKVSPAKSGEGLELKTADHLYRILTAPGEARFEDGTMLKSDGTFALLRNQNTAIIVGGTRLDVEMGGTNLEVAVDKPATVSAEWAADGVTVKVSGDIQYDTHGGQDHYREPPSVDVTFSGDMWKVTKRQTQPVPKTNPQ